MRKLSALTLAVCLFAAPVLGGEVNTPGIVNPPSCTENCKSATASVPTASATDYLTQALLELAIAIVTP